MASNATDTRIVQMQFDNRDFERNVKTSEKTLEKFKEHLDFDKCTESLDKFQKATKNLTFEHLADNVQKLTDKFTGLGTLTERVLAQIRSGIDSTMIKVSRFVESLSFAPISEGKDKFEQLNKNVQSIMSATGRSESEVYKVMQRLNAYTDQTSYSFTDMASNIGKFTSVGIKLEDAEKQMEGIANWAARSGAGINEASRAMYNLSQAMGVGKLTKIDWKSIENANMATKEFKEQLIEVGLAEGKLVKDTKTGVIKTAKSLGKQLEVNYQNLAETLSKGWADRSVLEKTLARYYYDDLYYSGENAIEVTEEQLEKIKGLFSDSDNKIDAKDFIALKDMGLSIDEIKKKAVEAAVAEGNLVEAGEKGGKKLYKTAKKYGKEIEFTLDNIDTSLSTGWLDKRVAAQIGLMDSLAKSSYEAAQKCTTLGDVFKAWQDQLSTGWMRVYTELFGNLTESMELFSAICNKVGEDFSAFIELLVGNTETGTRGIFGSWADRGGRDSLWSLFVGEYDGLYEGAYGILDVLHDVGNMISDAFWEMFRMMDPTLYNSETWGESIEFRADVMGAKIRDAIEGVREWLQGVKQFFMEVPKGASKSRFEQIQDIVNGVGATATIVFNTISDISNFFIWLADKMRPAVDDIIMLFSALGIELKKTAVETSQGKGLAYFLEDLKVILEPLVLAVKDFVHAIAELLMVFIGADQEGSKIISVWQTIADVLKKVAKVISKVATPIVQFFTNVIHALKDLFSGGINPESIKAFGERVKEALKQMIDGIFNFIPNFTGRLSEIWKKFKNIFSSGFSKESIGEFRKTLGKFFKDFKAALPQGLKSGISGAVSAIRGFISNAWMKIKGFFAPFFADVKNVFTSGFSKESVGQLKERFRTIFKSVSDAIPEEVKGAFRGVADKVKTFFVDLWNRIKNFFEPLVNDIRNLFVSGFSKDSVKQLKDRFKTIFKSVGDSVPQGMKEGGKNIVEKVKEFFKNLWKNIKEAIKGLFTGKKEGNEAGSVVGEFTTGFLNNVTQELDPGFKEVKSHVMNIASNILNPDGSEGEIQNGTIFDRIIAWIKEKFAKFRAFIQNLVGNKGGDKESLSTAMKGLDLSSIALVLIGALGVVGIVKVVKKIMGLVKDIHETVDTVAHFPEVFRKSMGASDKQSESFADKFLKIAGALAIVTACLVVIGNMHWTAALQGTLVIIALMAAMAVTLKVMKKSFSNMSYQDIKGVRTAILGFIGIAAAIWILVQAMLPLANVPTDKLKELGISLAAIIASFVAVAVLAKRSDLSFKSMSGLIAFAGAVWLLIQALMPMRNITDPMDWVRMFGTLGVILLELFAFCALVNKFAGGGVAGKGLLELAGVVAAIAILVLALMPLTLVNWEQLGKMVAFLGVVLLELATFVFIVSRFCKSMDKTGMIQLAAVAASIAILVLALLPVALLSEEQIGKMITTLTSLLVIIGLFVLIVGRSKGTMMGSGMAQLLGVAGAVVLLVLAMIPLALMSPEQIQQALLAVEALVVTLLTLVVIVNKGASGGLKGAGMAQLLGVAGAIILLVIAMIPLALMPLDKLLQAGGTIVALLLSMALITFTLSKLKGGKQALANMATLILLAGVIYVFALSIDMIKNVDANTISAFATGLAILIAAIVGSMLLMSLINNPAAMVTSMLIIVAGLAAVLGVIALMAPLVLNSIGSALENLMGQLAIMAELFKDFTGSMAGVSDGDLDSIKVKFEKLLDIIWSMRNVGNYESIVRSFENCMLKLANAVGMFEYSTAGMESPNGNNGIAFIRAIIGLKSDMAGFSIGSFDTDIVDLGEALGAFVGSVTVTGTESEAYKLLEGFAGQASNLETISKLPIEAISSKLYELGGALGVYATGAMEATGLGEGELPDTEKAVELMKSVVGSLTSEELSGLELPELPAETDMEGFGLQLAALAEAMKTFAAASNGLGDYSEALNVLTFMSELKTKLKDDALEVFNTMGAEYLSVSSLTKFGTQISALGSSLKRFSERTQNFTMNQNVTDALDFLATLKGRLTENRLRVVKVFSDADVDYTTLTNFANEIGELGIGLSSFAKNVDFEDPKEEKFKAAIKALDQIAGIAVRLPIVGGLAGLINGNRTSLGDLGNDMQILGTGFAKFFGAINGEGEGVAFDENLTTKVDSAIKAIDAIADIANKLPVLGGLAGLIHGNQETVGELGDDMKELGLGLSFLSNALEGTNEIKDFNADLVNGALDTMLGLVQIVEAMSIMSEKFPTSGWNVSVFTQQFTQLMNEFAFASDAYDDNEGRKMVSIAQSFAMMAHDFDDAFDAWGNIKHVDAFTAFRSLAEGLGALISSTQGIDFENIGNNISLGIAQGIRNKRSDVVNAAIDVCVAAIRAAKQTTRERSPSRVFEEIGAYCTQGLAFGITDETDTAVNATEKMLENVIDSADSPLNNLSTLLAGEIDLNPTISPVLDLSNIAGGSAAINDLLNNPYGLDLTGGTIGINASAIRDLANTSLPSDYTEPIVNVRNEISSLREDLQTMSESIRSMKFVMSSGAVVAAIGNDMDEWLGTHGYYVARTEISG